MHHLLVSKIIHQLFSKFFFTKLLKLRLVNKLFNEQIKSFLIDSNFDRKFNDFVWNFRISQKAITTHVQSEQKDLIDCTSVLMNVNSYLDYKNSCMIFTIKNKKTSSFVIGVKDSDKVDFVSKGNSNIYGTRISTIFGDNQIIFVLTKDKFKGAYYVASFDKNINEVIAKWCVGFQGVSSFPLLLNHHNFLDQRNEYYFINRTMIGNVVREVKYFCTRYQLKLQIDVVCNFYQNGEKSEFVFCDLDHLLTDHKCFEKTQNELQKLNQIDPNVFVEKNEVDDSFRIFFIKEKMVVSLRLINGLHSLQLLFIDNQKKMIWFSFKDYFNITLYALNFVNNWLYEVMSPNFIDFYDCSKFTILDVSDDCKQCVVHLWMSSNFLGCWNAVRRIKIKHVSSASLASQVSWSYKIY